MTELSTRLGGVPRILIGIGLPLTIVLLSPWRFPPLGDRPNPLNLLWSFGVILLAMGAFAYLARSRPVAKELSPAEARRRHERGLSLATAVAGFGAILLLVGGCPWLYTPQFFHGETNSSSGLIGTMIFIVVGLPGLTITAIGLSNRAKHRRALAAPGGGGKSPNRSAQEDGDAASARSLGPDFELDAAAVRGDLAEVTRLLDLGVAVDGTEATRGVPLEQGDRHYAWTPLHRAAFHGRVAVARALLDRGADADAADRDSCTPLTLAAGACRWDVVRLLAERGGDPARADAGGTSAIGAAEHAGQAELVAFLRGASPGSAGPA